MELEYKIMSEMTFDEFFEGLEKTAPKCCCCIGAKQQERIAELEDAVMILHRANKNWRLIVSQDDDFLITRIVSEIESK